MREKNRRKKSTAFLDQHIKHIAKRIHELDHLRRIY